MSKLHNLSSTDLADEFGALDLQIKALTERKDALKDEIKARGLERVEGPKFTVTVSTSTRTTYDEKAIRAALGDEICKQYERNSETVTIRVKPTAIFAGIAAE